MRMCRSLLAVFLIYMSTTVDAQVLVDVFHWGEITKAIRLPDSTIRLHNLNAPNEINRQLPRFAGSPVQAENAAGNWIQSDEGKAFTEALRVAYDGHMLARKYQLQKAPAIVFDSGKYVVYGSTDVRHALLLYRQASK
ncbi:DUF1525 domain-containing protein [Cellvibrio sp. ARAG 10.3]|uniref:DUF1525 domain-containing protein n=1 Tax=Cellvibrio sp. ARAG 10.3 TaxID=3451358 RepID=UPI003F459457